MYGLMRRRSMMIMALPVPTERLIYSLTNYTCDGTANTFIDTGIKLFGLEYDSFRIEMEYDGLDLTQAGLATLLECKSFGGSFNPGLSVKVSNDNQPAYTNAIAINIYPYIIDTYFKNTSSATVIITYGNNSGSINVNGNIKTGSGRISHSEPLTIGGRYSSHLSNPDRFAQFHISSLKIYATPFGIDTSYIYTPLTFKCLTGGDLSIKNANTSWDRNFEYSLNGGAWTAFSLPANTASKLIATLYPNDTISFRRDNDNFADAQFLNDSNLSFDIYGNLLSLQYGSAFNGETELRNTNKQAFGPIFKETNVVDASNLMLTATTLSNECYSAMFQNCTYLTHAPEIYAKALVGTQGHFQRMFSGCSSLIKPPSALYVSTLTVNCYKEMFYNCTSLETAPQLPATTLVKGCYYRMFFGCTNLIIAPELPATTLVQECYYELFKNCNRLNYIKCLATDITASFCLSGWVTYISSTGTFVKASGVTWLSGNSGIPNNWTVIEE